MISLVFNIWLIKIITPKTVLSIDNKSIIKEQELLKSLEKKYKIHELNNQANSYIIEKEANKNNFSSPNKMELKKLNKKFPEMNINKSNKQPYYVYHLFNLKNNDAIIKKYFKEKYQLTTPKMYQVLVYQTINHNLATKLENELKSGKSANMIEKELKINFEKTNTVHLDFLQLSTSNDNSLTTDINDYNIGKVVHLMNDDGMTILFVSKIVDYAQNPKLFKDMYFANNYQTIKSNLINKLSSKHEIVIQ
ncbi:hypothetical protein [Bacillus sp. AFS017336]|uniref:hypothetical protein n=1 Tax=Bacillus sp. AFS017336 TaxID=2033489 RepID=UPI000BEFC170|nr:hypothetical protein [Bacillus sp. AFS017336]PEL08322.1 hypothetical protein CN601_17035 [Bacillus sp. AFS017336]